MRQRTQRRKRKRAENAVVRGDEPPDPISLSTALLISTGVGAATAIGVPFLNKALAPKTPAMPKLGQTKSPLAGESTKLTPGQKVNAINTTPQGLLEPASTARNTLLGN